MSDPPGLRVEWFTMSVGGDQLIAVALLGVALALGAGLFFLLIALVKRTWAWMVGSHLQAPKEDRKALKTQPVSEAVLAVTASDLFIVRSNLDAVSRQVEDLERKLRAAENHGAKIISLTRKSVS